MKDVQIQEVLALDEPLSSPLDLIELGARGIYKRQIKHLAGVLCVTSASLAAMLAITPRTIQRHPEEKRFDRVVSERAIKLAMLAVRGIRVFGNKDEFCSWLQSPAIALGNRTPLSLLSSAIGLGMVEDVLGRIEHGVYS
jgi:putative toxin-antitoxin system antitoxin component (TIGR02293 family)